MTAEHNIAFRILTTSTSEGFYFSVRLSVDGQEVEVIKGPFPYPSAEEAARAARAHVQLFTAHPQVGGLVPAAELLKDLTDATELQVAADFLPAEDGAAYQICIRTTYRGYTLVKVESVAIPAEHVPDALTQGFGMLRARLESEAPELALPEDWTPDVTLSAPQALREMYPSIFGEEDTTDDE